MGTLLVTLTLLCSVFSLAQGGYTPWTMWGRCTVSCAGGSQFRFRDCYDASICGVGRQTENRNCNTLRCPIHGGWEPWESWTGCSKLCGGGISSRERSCDAPVPDFGGRFCVGGKPENIDIQNVEWEHMACNTQPCPVNGAWTEWTPWSNCTATCAGGTQTRARTCTAPAPAYGGSNCVGEISQTKQCNSVIPCAVDGGWVPWSEWSYCSASCTGGLAFRSRTCTNPFPIYNGKPCVGLDTINRTCNADIPCPVEGEWTKWGLFGACSSSCAGGTKTRSRTCTTPKFGGYICLTGEAKESVGCNGDIPCSVDGQWSLWGVYTACSSTCVGGKHSRSRTCTNPIPALGGKACVGLATDISSCNDNIGCPVDGIWTPWDPWTACTAECGGGQQTRRRACIAPPPTYGGAYCAGSEADARDCNLDVPCP